MVMSYVSCNWCRRIGLATPGEDGPFCGACGSNNCDDWPAPEVQQLFNWDTLARERNRFVHGERRDRVHAAVHEDIGVDLHELGIRGLKVFIELTNRYTPNQS
jgi:hypothetical protein